MLKGFFELAKGLVFAPEKTTTGVLNELIKSASNPDEVYKALMQARQDKDIQVALYRLQGDPEAAARLEMKWQMDFYSNFILVNRVGKLGQVPKMLADEEAMVTLQGTIAGKELSELKGVSGLPEWYRDISGVGANVAAPEGYKAVVNTKTGNIEYLASDGTLYLNTDAGLRPKLGGNLAELAAAEREMQASKGGDSGFSGRDAKGEQGSIEPPTSKVDVTNDFMVSVSNGGITLRYGNPEGVAGLVVNVDKAGVLGFEIRAAQNHPFYDASGTDMFASAMQRLGN